MFNPRIIYQGSRYHDMRDAAEIGVVAGSAAGQVTRWLARRITDAFIQQVDGTHLVVGHLLNENGRQGESIAILESERMKHAHIVGPTGTGKTTLLANMIIQDIKQGEGIGVIDIQGDLTQIILSRIPLSRADDVIVLDATDTDYPFGFNIMDITNADERTRITGEIIGVFKKTVGQNSWGPRLEHVLRFALLTLLSKPETTLLDLRRLLVNDDFREEVLSYVKDRSVLEFWDEEFNVNKPGQRFQIVLPILNKIGPYIAYSETRNIIGQRKSSFNLRQIMDSGKILMVKLPQGELGEDFSSFLGALIVSKIQMAVFTRADMEPSMRRPFLLYVDEFQNFVTDSFDKILTQARAFGLGLVVANQYIEQLPANLALAVEKNVAVKVECFRELGNYRAALTEMHEYDHPCFLLEPLPPLQFGSEEMVTYLYQQSRHRFGRPKDQVESELYSSTPKSAEVEQQDVLMLKSGLNEEPFDFSME